MKAIPQIRAAAILAGLLLPTAICHAIQNASPSANDVGDHASGTALLAESAIANNTTAMAAGSPADQQKSAVPSSLTNAAEAGEGVYDAAHANNWAQAEDRFSALKSALSEIPKARHSDALANLERTIAGLDAELAARQQQAVMRDANEVTRLVAQLTLPYHPAVPVDVVMLDYYGRALEVWSAAKDMDKLTATKTAIRQTWDQLRPNVAAHGHTGLTEARSFDRYIDLVWQAKSVADYANVAAPFLEEVDKVEQVFAG